MNRRCSRCGGTGKEICEVHGYHPCGKCDGQGCVEEGDNFELTIYDKYRSTSNEVKERITR